MIQTGISRKIYLELTPPTESDNVSAQRRILRALETEGWEDVEMSVAVLRALYPLCEEAGWKVTVSLGYDGGRWQAIALEAGDTSREHYGLAVDLGSTTVVMQLVNCDTGETVAQKSAYNRQIAFGEDILTRIFYSKDNEACLEELRKATVGTIQELLEDISGTTGIPKERCLSMVIAGNTTMTHFLLGLDAFCVFSAPNAVLADQPGFLRGRDLDIPIPGYVFCYPGKANYLGGDILAGMIATGMHRRDTISLFFDVGTNGELVVGNREFLLCGAGAAGPALEGGVVKTGMRAAEGAVQHVRIDKTEGFYIFDTDVIGGGVPRGICGSGIIDLLSGLFLLGGLDMRGWLVPEASPSIVWQPEEGEYAVSYAPGLWFYQSDVNEFIRTKAAAYTMMEYLLTETGIPLEEVCDFYMAGAFGSHVETESAVNIGMYPDVEPERIHAVGNTSLEGARRLLLDMGILEGLSQILDLMTYVQFSSVENFLENMVGASALPHTDLERYPSVKARLDWNRR
ncbi:MAG: ASKHA domain-containing protein [Clostridiales bacterium]|nr:ASKHA domain-containing protein [Clostridiales bacterium]